MKWIVALAVLIFPNSGYAASKQVSCGLAMYQFKSDQKMFPVIGDTNQRLIIQLTEDAAGGLRGEAQARFLNDQSDDRSNSLHGAKVVVSLSEGSLVFSLSVLKFQNKNDKSAYEAVATVASAAPEADVKQVSLGYLNPKAPDPQMDLWPLVRSGAVSDYELYSLEIRNCWLVGN